MSDPDRVGDAVHARIWVAVRAALDDRTNGFTPLERVARACLDLLPVDGASISVIASTDHRETLYASDELITRLESIQFTLGEGPCFEAFRTARPVLVPDLAHTVTGWPVFASEVASLPVGAMFSFPIQSGAICFGAIDMYRRRAGPLVGDELTLTLRVVDVAAAAVLTLRNPDLDHVARTWQAPLPTDSQYVVHQATGMLSYRLQIPIVDALARLRGHAFRTSRLVGDVAADVVAGDLDLPAGPDDDDHR